MNTTEENRFRPLYEKMQQCLVLQGLRPKTVEAYSRAIRRLAEHFDRCADELTTYSMGLRLAEGLQLEIGDIDCCRKRVHIRGAKGGKDRLVPLPEVTLRALRQFWKCHHNSRLWFPSWTGDARKLRNAQRPMDRGGVQSAIKAAVADSGISRKITMHSLRHSFATLPGDWVVDCRSVGTGDKVRSPTQSGQQFEVMRTAFRRNADSDSKLCGHFDVFVVMVSAMARAGVRIPSVECPHNFGIGVRFRRYPQTRP